MKHQKFKPMLFACVALSAMANGATAISDSPEFKIGRIQFETTPAVRMSQTPAPDDSAVSVLFSDLTARTVAGQCRESSSVLVSLTVQPTAAYPAELVIHARGFTSVERAGRAQCVASLNDQVVTGASVEHPENFILESILEVTPRQGPATITIFVACGSHGGPGSDGMVEIDSLDIRIRPKGEK